MSSAVMKRFGAIDVLINNAGKFAAAPFAEMSVSDFDELVAANLRSVFLVSRAFAPGMVKRGRGDIFNMSSIAGRSAYPGGAAYCAAFFILKNDYLKRMSEFHVVFGERLRNFNCAH